jgi:uncharacterized protein YndB with AHSA1/START domain
MAESRFVYVTYIRTAPEKLWQALIDPEFTRQYWVETRQEARYHARCIEFVGSDVDVDPDGCMVGGGLNRFGHV